MIAFVDLGSSSIYSDCGAPFQKNLKAVFMYSDLRFSAVTELYRVERAAHTNSPHNTQVPF